MGLATVGTARTRIVNDQASVPIHLAFYCILREGGGFAYSGRRQLFAPMI
jgi:hypothetical protein